jgi:hypothetical protein
MRAIDAWRCDRLQEWIEIQWEKQKEKMVMGGKIHKESEDNAKNAQYQSQVCTQRLGFRWPFIWKKESFPIMKPSCSHQVISENWPGCPSPGF